MFGIAERNSNLATDTQPVCNSEPEPAPPSKAMLVVDPNVLNASTLKALIRLGAMYVTLPAR